MKNKTTMTVADSLDALYERAARNTRKDRGVMTLTEELDAMHQQSGQQIPAPTQEIMDEAGAKLANSGLTELAIRVGDMAPDFVLPSANGGTVQLRTQLEAGPVVLSFYRGGWCPYCNIELKALQNALPQFKSLGATLITVSPESPDNSLTTKERNQLEFDVLSDTGNVVSKTYGVTFQLDPSLRELYDQFGIDLTAYNGDQEYELPVPATYVISQDGTVALAFVDTDYTKRLDPQKIIEALEQL